MIQVGDMVTTEGGFTGKVLAIHDGTAWVEFPERGHLNRVEPYKLSSLVKGQAA